MLSCPYCKKRPLIQHITPDIVQISCKNKMCFVRPQTKILHINEALRVWNKRSHLTLFFGLNRCRFCGNKTTIIDLVKIKLFKLVCLNCEDKIKMNVALYRNKNILEKMWRLK